MKSLSVFRCFFHLLASVLLKNTKLERVMTVQTHACGEENGGFFLFFHKKSSNLHHITAFFGKIRKILNFLHHRRGFEQS